VEGGGEREREELTVLGAPTEEKHTKVHVSSDFSLACSFQPAKMPR